MPKMTKTILTLLATLVVSVSFAQQTVTGTVFDNNHKPLMGASVTIDGTNIMTLSKSDGSYSIVVPEEYATNPIVIRYVGYIPKYLFSKSSTDVVFEPEVVKDFEDVYVTTQKRLQSSIEVPIALTALDNERLYELNATSIDEVSGFVPGFNAIIQSQNKSGYAIRGVTSDGMESFFQPRISVYLNGVSASRLQSSVIGVYDMERIEAVRGPQGTLFGRGAEIGAVHFITKRPENEFSAQVEANYGTYNQRGAKGYVNLPMGEKVADRFAFYYNYHDGYIKNLAGGTLNGMNSIGLRNTLRIAGNSESELNLILDYQYDNTPGVSFKSSTLAPVGGDTSPYTAAYLNGGTHLGVKRHMAGVTLDYSRSLGEHLSMSNILGVRESDADEFFDADGSYLRLIDSEEEAHAYQISNEFRLNWDGGQRLNGFIGAGVMYENCEHQLILQCNQKEFYPNVVAKQVKAQTEGFPSMVSQGVKQGLEGFKQQLLSQYPAAYSDQINQLLDAYSDAVCPQIQTSLSDKMYSWYNSNQWDNIPDFLGDTQGVVNGVLVNTLNAMMAQNPMIGQLLNGATADQVVSQLNIGEQLAQNDAFKVLASASGVATDENYQENQTNYTHNLETDVFLDLSWNVIDNFYITMGLRGTYERQKTGYMSTAMTMPMVGSMIYVSSNGETVWTEADYFSFVGRLVFNYMLNRTNNLYLSLSKGHRPGVVYFDYDPNKPGKLQPEAIYSLELGVKGNVFSNTLSYAASFYRYNWLHFQSSTASFKDDGSIGYTTTDKGKASSTGAEISLKYYFERYASIFADLNYTDGKFADKDEDGNPQQWAGNSFRLSPKNTFDFGADVVYPLHNRYNLYFRPNFTFMGKIFFEDNNKEELSQEGYSTLNATLGVRFTRNRMTYDFALWGKNIANSKYLIDAGNAGQSIGFPTFVAGSPATFGVRVILGVKNINR